MSANGYTLHYELPAYYGAYLELNPGATPITSLAAARGIEIVPNKVYQLVTHSNYEAGASDMNLKPDNSSATFGSTSFAAGSNTVQVWDEGAADTWARRGDQRLATVQGWQNRSNPSVEPSTLSRGRVEALWRIKSQQEYISYNGDYTIPHAGTAAGTTGTWEQRGIRNDPNLTVGTAGGAVAGSGTIGTMGTLTKTILMDTVQSIWENRLLNPGRPLTALCNATVKRVLTDMMISDFNFGKNGVSRTEAGVNLLRFETDFGPLDIVLSHNLPGNDLILLNYDYINMVGRIVPGKELFQERVIPQTTAADAISIYHEGGLNYQNGNAHGVIFGIGSAISAGVPVS